MIVILCQGRASRLQGSLPPGQPKHLIKFLGESILGRTLRLITESPMPPRATVVVGPASLQPVVHAGLAERHELPHPGECVLQGLAGTYGLWKDEPTVTVLLGDVIWSRRAIHPFLQASFSTARSELSFAVSHDLTSSEGEVYGFHADQSIYADIMKQAAACDHNTGNEQCGHMRRLIFSRDPRLMTHGLWPIDDWTCDVDEPIDLTHLPRLNDCDAWDDLVWHAQRLLDSEPAHVRRVDPDLVALERAMKRIREIDQPRCKCGRIAIMTCTTCSKPRGSCNCAMTGGG